MLSMGLYGKNGVSGDLRWVGTRPSTDCPVCLGIPFLKGELEADGRVVLKDGGGSGIPSDCWPLAYWPDGSVKWLGVTAVVPGEAEGIRFETVGKKHKMKNRSETKIQVDETTSFLRVSTGKVEAYIPKRGSCLLDSLRCGGRAVGGQAALRVPRRTVRRLKEKRYCILPTIADKWNASRWNVRGIFGHWCG